MEPHPPAASAHANGATPAPPLSVIRASDLSPAEWSALNAVANDWYATPGHCLLYAHEPAEWVALWRDRCGTPLAACFWTPARWLRRFRVLKLAGPTTATPAMLKTLLKRQRAGMLSIPYCEGTGPASPLPWWQSRTSPHEPDWIIPLPASLGQYMDSLGRTSRRHLAAYARRLENQLHPNLVVQERAQIQPELLAELIELHRQRMANAGKNFWLTPAKIERRIRLAHECGLFCGRLVDGRLIGGTLNFCHGSTATLSLVAHDPRHDALHCGLVCLLDTIEQLIATGFKTYNLHFRYSPFKPRLGGVEHPYHQTDLFSNPAMAVLRNGWAWKKKARGLSRYLGHFENAVADKGSGKGVAPIV